MRMNDPLARSRGLESHASEFQVVVISSIIALMIIVVVVLLRLCIFGRGRFSSGEGGMEIATGWYSGTRPWAVVSPMPMPLPLYYQSPRMMMLR